MTIADLGQCSFPAAFAFCLSGACHCYLEEESLITAVKKPALFVIWEVVLWIMAIGGMLNAGGDCDANGEGARIVLYTVFLVMFAVGSAVNYSVNGNNS